MRILHATSELHPYSKSGGLADMVAALAKAQGSMGHDVAIITPLYRGLRESHPSLERLNYELKLPLGERWAEGIIWKLYPWPNVTVYFIEQDEYFNRAELYAENGFSYQDNDERYLFFSKAVAHLARYLYWKPEVLNLHDWQTGFVPALIQHQAKSDGWVHPPPTCLTIHNLAYQGTFPKKRFELTNLPDTYFTQETSEFFGLVNFLKAGLALADKLTTVSPRYAREITTQEYGCGLDGLLRDRQKDLTGILNGVDYEEWTTQKNPFLNASYSVRSLAGKRKIKAALQEELGLSQNLKTPLFGSITRLADQKGIELMLGALEEMLASDMQFVQLGSGSPEYEAACQELAQRHPGKVAVRIGYNTALAHRIEAASDFFLMPSRYEPCGLNQIYSLRYGTIPIVRVTGGLDDSVIDPREDVDAANGLKFNAYKVRALAKAIRKAIVLYHTPDWLLRFRNNGLRAQFDWDRSARHYQEVYQQMLAAQAD